MWDDNVLISLIVIIIEQCICIPKHHIVHLKYISMFICQSYLNKSGEKNLQQLSIGLEEESNKLEMLFQRQHSLSPTPPQGRVSRGAGERMDGHHGCLADGGGGNRCSEGST